MHMLVLKNYYTSILTAFSFVSTVIKYIPTSCYLELLMYVYDDVML